MKNTVSKIVGLSLLTLIFGSLALIFTVAAKYPKCTLLLSVLTLFFITKACDNSPTALAERHLNLLKSNKANEALRQYCNSNYEQTLKTVKTFRITDTATEKSTTRTKSGDYSPFQYTDVTAEIETEQFPEKSVSVSIKVWKTDDFYQFIRESYELPLSAYSRNPETSRKAREWHEERLPKREEFNRNHECISLYVRR